MLPSGLSFRTSRTGKLTSRFTATIVVVFLSARERLIWHGRELDGLDAERINTLRAGARGDTVLARGPCGCLEPHTLIQRLLHELLAPARRLLLAFQGLLELGHALGPEVDPQHLEAAAELLGQLALVGALAGRALGEGLGRVDHLLQGQLPH